MKLGLIAAAVLFFSSCGTKITDYYPLREGVSRVYQINKSEKQTIENFKLREMNKVSVVPQKIVSAKGTAFHFIALDKDGVFRYAVQAPNAVEPTVLALPESAQTRKELGSRSQYRAADGKHSLHNDLSC
jgi:hypothetical protein